MPDKKLIVMSLNEQFPQPSESELSEEPSIMKMFNAFQWRIYQGVMSNVNQEFLWPDHNADLETLLTEMLIQDEPIDAEWVKVYDFSDVDGGFSIVTGGGGTWVSGLGWRSTLVSGQAQVHIEKSFAATGITGLAIFFGSSTIATNVNTIEAKLLQGASEATMLSANPPNISLQDVTVEGTTYENVTRLRLRLHSTGTNQQATRFIWLVVWGEGEEPA